MPRDIKRYRDSSPKSNNYHHKRNRHNSSNSS